MTTDQLHHRWGHDPDLGYTHGFYRELTPAMLSLVGLAKGVRAPDTTKPLTYCELGCGQGFSMNVLAAANPHVQFYATDFNPAHIVGAKALQSEAGVSNVHFYDQSFAEFLVNDALPEFDIVSLHGIYSWIHAEHRATIVEFIRRKLKPGGLVYISYNALPGWSSAAPMRHLMYLHGKATGGPTAGRLDPALQFIERLFESNAGYTRSNPTLRERFDRTKGLDRNYLAHEYLNEAWTLFYHSDVAAELSAAKLSYVGSAALLENIDVVNLTSEQQTIPAGITDSALKETVRDYLVNQQFRRDVFVKGSVTLSGEELRELWLQRAFVLTKNRADIPLKAKGSLGEVELKPEAYEPILDGLASGPRSVKDLASDPRIAAVGWGGLQQALVILCGAGVAEPALGAKPDSARVNATTAFNRAVTKRARSGLSLTHLASPVTGGGVHVGRSSQWFLHALSSKAQDVPAFVWAFLEQQGQKLIKNGVELATPEENLAELRNVYAAFVEKELPVLKQLGIA